jgi:hypothetical protein
MSRLTIFIGRLMGLFFVLFALAMLVNRHSTVEAAIDFMHDPPVLMIAGIMALLTGLAIVLGHNVWSGGALPLVVTLLGWIFVIRGIVILAMARETLVTIFEKMNFDGHYYLFVGIVLAIGLYLMIASFTASAPAEG